jgi:hypothetical protein
MPTAGGTTGFEAGAGASAGAGFDGSGLLQPVSEATIAIARTLDSLTVHTSTDKATDAASISYIPEGLRLFTLKNGAPRMRDRGGRV